MKGTAASIQREEAEQTDETPAWRLMHVAYMHGFAHCSSTPPLNDKAPKERRVCYKEWWKRDGRAWKSF
jgi:hypothetical protein